MLERILTSFSSSHTMGRRPLYLPGRAEANSHQWDHSHSMASYPGSPSPFFIYTRMNILHRHIEERENLVRNCTHSWPVTTLTHGHVIQGIGLVPRPHPRRGKRVWHASSHSLVLLTQHLIQDPELPIRFEACDFSCDIG